MDPNIFRTRAGCVVISKDSMERQLARLWQFDFTTYHIDITNRRRRRDNVRYQVVIKIVIAFPPNPSYLITHGYIR